ncbi:MAG: CpXC domain-containing protein [Spirochaetaceae bacterium]|nr:CpXC domain-containing protein [Spirochaetaceae bacterium]
MKRKIPCPCDNTFTVEVPESIDLDVRPEYLTEILNGSFMNFTCSSCGKKHKPEFPITLLWPSRHYTFEVLPEQERLSFYRRKKEKKPEFTETLIGYPELADRLVVIRDGLVPIVVEALKYYLLLKAEETNAEGEISVWYQNREADHLEFHLHGLRDGEVAVTRVPVAVYEKTAGDFRSHPKTELFSSLRFGSYISVQNMMAPTLPGTLPAGEAR